MLSKPVWLFQFAFILFTATLNAQDASLNFLNKNQPVLDAHNCYPYEGRWANRIDRALSTGFPVGIEQDLAWYVDPATGAGRVVVSHTPKTTGSEPTLREYFFEHVKPVVQKALRDQQRDRWPLIVLHFDFKDNQAPLLHAVWDLLGQYEPWITTARKTADPHQLSPFDAKPLLVLTEESDAQQKVFFDDLAVGSRLRLFGSAHTKPVKAESEQERNRLLASVPPNELLGELPTNYRRWWNGSWFNVEEGGASRAGDWTAADASRLHALVDHAHQLGFWIRFYTLDGFTAASDKGWGQPYNFGSLPAARLRWQAALEAGVNLIATDQYEELTPFMRP
jgi:hypothetical protein